MLEINKLPKITARKAESHKGDYGRALVIAGSLGLTGAAYLCAKSTLRSGAGLVTLGIPKSLNPAMEVKLTCVMTLPLPETESGTFSKTAKKEIIEFAKKFNVCIIGPGLSLNQDTRALTAGLLKDLEIPIVLDADGINAIAGNLNLLREAKNDVVITPHPGELAGLMGLKSSAAVQADRQKTAKEFIEDVYRDEGENKDNSTRKRETVLVLKGHKTIVINKNNLYINNTGNPGMASGGSGDVLSGIIGALIAQGYAAFEAAQLGVYIHGLAGDIAAKKRGEISMIATDIIECLPEAFLQFS